MKRTLAMLLCLAMLLSYMPSMLFTASADDAVTPGDGDISVEITPDDEVVETTTSDASESTPAVHTEYCAACDEDVVWTAVTSGTQISSANETHFYLSEDCTYASAAPVISVEAGATVCVDLNGYTLTTAAEINVKGVLNIQGEGSVIGNSNKTEVDFDDLVNAGQGGETVAYNTALINIAAADAAVNIYGGTYSVVNDMPIVAFTEAGKLNVLGGEIDGTVSGDNLTLGGAAKVTMIETSKLTVKSDWTGSAVVNAAALETGVAEGDFTGSLKTPQGRNVINDNGTLKVSVMENNPVQEAALDMVFPTDGSDYTAVCPACNKEVTWKPLKSGERINRDKGTHFYMAEDSTVNSDKVFLYHYSSNPEDTMCLHLNGKTINARSYIDASRSILNIMGDGVVNSNGASSEFGIAVINVTHPGANTHLYGGTYIASGDAAYSINFKVAGKVTSYEGVTFVGNVNAPVGQLIIENGTLCGVQGENITWTFENGDLTISGTGAMASGVEGTNVSWYGVNGSVKNFNIGAGITGMDDSALAGTTILEAVNVDAENATYTSVDGVLYTKDQTTLLMIPGNLSGEITIPAAVTTIDEAAFFNASQLTAINVDPANENYSSVDGVLFNKDQTKLIRFPAKKAGAYTIPGTVTSVAAYAFAYCEELTAVVMPDSVTELGENTFYSSDILESITLSKNLTAIPAYMCAGCTMITTADIPNGVTSIGTYAYNKASVAVATIPASVTEIGKGAFRNCPLTDVYYGSTEEDWDAISYEPTVMTGFTDELVAATKHYYVAPVITGITVTAPTKVEYELGEELVLDGMVVTGVYSDETTAPITEGYEVSGFDSETAGTKTITVSYGDFTATFEVTVKEAPVVLTGITVTAPTKVEYQLGEELALGGMVVTGTYSNETTAPIAEGYTVSGFDSNTAGVKTITVTYGDFTATFEVTVNAPADVNMTIATANADAGITVTWTATGGDKFQVYVSALTGDAWSEWTSLSAGTTSKTYTYKTATAGTQYKFKVVALTSDVVVGEIVSEPIARVTTPTPAVSNIMNGVQLTWSATEGAEIYYIYRNERIDAATNTYGEFVKIGETTDTTYIDETAVNGGRYSYAVRTLSNGNLSAEVAPASGKRILRIEAVEVTTENTVGGIRIKWTENDASPKFYLYRSVGTVKDGNVTWGAYTRLVTIENANIYSDLTAKSGYLYRYALRGINNTQQSCDSNPSEIMRLAVSTATVSNQAAGIQVNWAAVAGASAYNLYRSEEVDGEWTAWGKPIFVTTDLTYMDSTAVNGVKYRYMARPVNTEFGNYISGAKTGAILYRLETATVTTEIVSSGIKISWNANTAATKYFVYESQYVDGAWTAWKLFVSLGKTTTTYTRSSLDNGAIMRFMIRVNKGDNQSQPKSTDQIIYIKTPTIKAVAATNGIKLTWGTTAAPNFDVLRRTYDSATGTYSDWELLTNTNAYEFVDTTAEKGVYYQYTLHAINGNNVSPDKATANVKW